MHALPSSTLAHLDATEHDLMLRGLEDTHEARRELALRKHRLRLVRRGLGRQG